MSNEIPNDFFGLNDAFKKIADAWNEGLEQAKLQSECKIRRFNYGPGSGFGVVFPGAMAVIQYAHDKSVRVYNNIDDFKKSHKNDIQWIDAEPEASK
jgi:hypothetical protein